MTWQEHWAMSRQQALRSGDRMKWVWAQWAYNNNLITLAERNRLLDS